MIANMLVHHKNITVKYKLGLHGIRALLKLGCAIFNLFLQNFALFQCYPGITKIFKWVRLPFCVLITPYGSK